MDVPLINALAAKLKHLAARQQVIAQNIANADTPGYRARDAAAPDFAAMVAGVAPARRQGVVMVSAPRVAGPTAMTSGQQLRREAPDEVTPDGNDVSLETELLKLSEVQMDYAATTSLYAKQMMLMKIALGRGGS